jgi:Apoptosis regulator proteins, Bcl-2 family
MSTHSFSKTVSGLLAHRLIQEIVMETRTSAPMTNYTREVYNNLKRIVVDQLEKNESTFVSMCEMLDLTSIRNEYPNEGRIDIKRKTLQKIADSMSADGCTNWGRVITLIAFCCQVAKLNIREIDHSDQFAHEIADFIAQYLDNEMNLLNLGGWDTLASSFPEKPHVKTLICKGLLNTFVGLAICSLALFVFK